MSRFARRLEASASGDAPKMKFRPWNFGIPHLDAVVSGVRPGFVNMIFARSHVGKTLLAMAGIRSNPDVPTLFLSADDEPDLVVRKMMFFDGLVGSVEEAWGITPSQMQTYIENNYPNLDIRDDVTWGPVAYNGEKSVADAVERFTEEFDGRPPELIVYDYLGIDGADYATTMQVSAWQKALARKMPMPILVIGQSNRQGAGAKMEKQPDGSFTRRGFRMEDMSFGGEQQAGLILGLTKSMRAINGRVQDVIEVDIVKNKAVFDGSGLTKPSEPIVLCHSNGRLTDMWTAEREALALEAWRREEANHAFNGYH